MNITELKPELIWKYFDEITQIPRPSKNEGKIREYLVNFGKINGFETQTDAIGNVVIRKNATSGFENLKSVVLQSHMDMVCEKNNDVAFDFDKDSIQTWIDGEWVKAKGTTLGGDDGIGIAASLAILMDDSIQHGPLECLFTVDEETGLTGAFELENSMVKSRILLNLDSEDEGELFIGCAGGRDTLAFLPYKMTKASEDYSALRIEIVGLTGGHSGDDINKGFANANILLVRILWQAQREFGLQLSHIDGGNLRNAIAREAVADVLIPNNHLADFKTFVKIMSDNFKAEYHVTEPNLEVRLFADKNFHEVIEAETVVKMLNALYACPHGVIAMSQDIANFVETSTNLASIKLKDSKIVMTTSQRSSVESALDSVCNKVNAVFTMIGAEILHTDGYPGWTPNTKSEVMEITKTAYIDLFKKEPKVLAIHAGLECGLIGKKFPGMDMISFGPTIKGAHSPDERMKIDTVKMFWDLIIEVLKRIPKA